MSYPVQNIIAKTKWFGEEYVSESTASDLTEWGLFGTTIAECLGIPLDVPVASSGVSNASLLHYHRLMEDKSASFTSDISPPPLHPSARALLKYAGKWAGDDLEQCLDEIYVARAEAEF